MDISLENKGQGHEQVCHATQDSEIVVSLKWTQQTPGLISRLLNRDVVDIDLGCYYLMNDGRRGVIDGLQFGGGNGGPRNKRSLQGCYMFMPYIWHTGDKSGNSGVIEERILINPEGLAKIKTIMVYCYIYDGEARWGETESWLRVSVPGCDDVVVNMKEKESDKKFCLVARIDIEEGHRLKITRIGEFYNTHSECGSHYDWQLAFKPNQK